MVYRVQIRRRAQKQLNRIQEEHRERTIEAVYALSKDPRPRNSRKLEGREGYRLRVGDYRALYRVNDETQGVLVAEIWHRQRDYR
jgi:mRNA interferase RelE/StbE